jgi:HPt (histidine-containing phosphotransfer) domain-containing protein
MGMNGYLAKPLQIGELKRILTEFLPLATKDPMQLGPLLSGEPVRFHELAEILGNDEGKLRYVLGVFERSTRSDWDLLEAAYAAGDRVLVYDLAHKLKSGCSQLGENLAALALEALEDKAKGHAGLDDEFVSARRELQQVLTHVNAHLSTRSI